MTWIPLENEAQIDKIIADSEQKPQVIFKHSTRCSISSMAKNRLDKKNAPEGINFFYLDLIQFRKLSNKIAADFHVTHQSPQVLVIDHGKCIYDESHSGISMEDIEANGLKN
jgi:bacillithiol system protein YtxJ